jgi:type III secretory pathway component EscU
MDTKIDRLIELRKVRDDAQKEIDEILGGAEVKQKRHRRTKAEMQKDGAVVE